MKLFKKKNALRQRVVDLENYLGLAYAEDGYGSMEHIEKQYGELPDHEKRIKSLEKGKK